MMKYVYKNEKGLVVLNQKVEILEFASVDDLRKEVKLIKEKLVKIEQNERILFDNPDRISKRTLHDELKMSVNDRLKLKDDVLYWDKDVNEFLSYESIQSFDNPFSWTDEEKVEFAEILLTWISSEDLTSNLYNYLRETNEGESVFDGDEHTRKLERLLCKELHNEGMLDLYNYHYEAEKLTSAKVEGGIN